MSYKFDKNGKYITYNKIKRDSANRIISDIYPNMMLGEPIDFKTTYSYHPDGRLLSKDCTLYESSTTEYNYYNDSPYEE